MAYIIFKKSKRYGQERFLYYLVESYRHNNKIKRRTLLHLHECKGLNERVNFYENKQKRLMERLLLIKKRLESYNGSNVSAQYMGSLKTSQNQLERLEKEYEQCGQEIVKVRSFM